MGEPVAEWGWELISSWDTVHTEAHRSVSAARIRRQGLGTQHGDAEPVAYAFELLKLFHRDPPLRFQDSDRSGSVAFALDDLAEAARGACPHCGRPTGAARCEHVIQARETVRRFNVWFADQVRAHGWPIAVVDSALTCRLVAERAAAHPDARFQAACRNIADRRLASEDIDPDHHAIICEPSTR